MIILAFTKLFYGMKTKLLLSFLTLNLYLTCFGQVHTTYLWHLHQPTYWGDKSKINPNRSQLLKESQELKFSGGNMYSDGLAHPLNDLQEIFGLPDRVAAYQFKCKNAIGSISHLPKAGAQVTYGGSLLEGINSLADANMWGYSPSWKENIKTAKSWKTSGGFPRMDLVAFTMHHTLSPLVSDEVLKKEIQAHKYYAQLTFGSQDSKGYWPAECSFSERIIKTLVEEGIEWTVVGNSHLARTLSDYPLVFGTNGCNIDPPNKADVVPTTGNNWHNGQIDGRGGQFAAPYCFMPHKAKYVDPNTGSEYKLTVVPMADLDSYRDGFSEQGIAGVQTNIGAFSSKSRPSLVLLAHDGDNAWGGGSSYYDEAVKNFSNAANGAGYTPTTIQQYLADYPVPDSDIVHVEDGSWPNAANDWGSPQFINWLWPLYDANQEFNPDGWTEDVRNQAVMVAAENHCVMAENLEGTVQIADIVNPTASASNAEKAWHFYMPGLDSGNAYYGDAIDLEIKATVAANNAIEFAQKTINANAGKDQTRPSVFIPQRYPYNPGEIGFGPNLGYKQKLNTADFTVWTLAYDVSGITQAVVKFRTDKDGTNPLTSNQNETYAGGGEVSEWQTLPMTGKVFPKGNVMNNPNISFFIEPTEISTLYHAKIKGISEKLVDYYVEVTDAKGNVTKTAIQHVWVGKNLNIKPAITFAPETNYAETAMEVTVLATDSTDPNPTIYYTTDGSAPTTTSTSAVGSVKFNVTQTTVVKAFAKDNEGNLSDVSTKTFYIGDVPKITVYVKAPAAWTTVKVHHWDALPAGSLANATWPGDAMTKACDGWYSYTFTAISSTKLIFNNGTGGTGNQTADLTVNGDAWYDVASSSWVTGPSGGNGAPCVSIDPKGGTFGTGTTVNVTISATDTDDANPTLYYTLDGSTPTTASASASKQKSLSITSNTTLKVMAKDATGNTSDVITETYTFTVAPPAGITVYFKPPTAWPTPKVYYWEALPAGSVTAATWPGADMTAHTDGWYKYTFPATVTSINAIFNNGSGGVGTNQTPDLKGITKEFWYDWTKGELLGTNDFDYSDYQLRLYPNPASETINIQTVNTIDEVQIYDAKGMLIKNIKSPSLTIDISDLSNGVYHFKFLTDNQKVIVKQVVKY
jgi:hypothetical protein